MTEIRTPPNPPDVELRKAGQCAAYGCPLWGTVRAADEWLCMAHSVATADTWQAATKRLRDNLPLVRAAHRALNLDPHQVHDWPIKAAEHMAKIGFPHLAPCVRRVPRLFRSPGGEWIEQDVELDEAWCPRIWATRVSLELLRVALGETQRLLEESAA